MRILLVWPWTRPKQSSSFFNSYYFKKFSPQDSAFPALISVTPSKHHIDVIKVADPFDIDYEKKYDLVAITSIIQDFENSYIIADEFRKHKIPVILGGWHPSSLPNEAMKHADSIVIGEADEIWPKLLKDLENNNLKPIYRQNKPVDLTKLPQPSNIYKNRKKINIMATRGCPYGCGYCAITNMKYRKVFRTRQINDVVDEIIKDTGKFFIFGDASLTINVDYSKELFRRLIPLNKKFVAFGNSNVLNKDDELLKLAADAGCIRWFVGFESICQQSLINIGKSNKVKDYISTIKKIHDHSMIVEGGIMIGFDDDTLDIFQNTYDFLIKSEIDIANIRILTPYPGTPIFNQFDIEGRLLTKDWNEYTTYKVVFKPKNMTVNQLQQGFEELYYKWHSTANTSKRIINSLRIGFFPFIESFKNNIKTSNLIKFGFKK